MTISISEITLLYAVVWKCILQSHIVQYLYFGGSLFESPLGHSYPDWSIPWFSQPCRQLPG
jgi:hypothetical protein